ncbi:MAG: hypothetical protein MJ149_01940 [Clostridia bacterium]|nr:hypothetical protein [Clostridia bacterium]
MGYRATKSVLKIVIFSLMALTFSFTALGITSEVILANQALAANTYTMTEAYSHRNSADLKPYVTGGATLTISSKEEMFYFNDLINNCYYTINSSDYKAAGPGLAGCDDAPATMDLWMTFYGVTVKLTADIDLGYETWTPIGSHSLDNLKLYSDGISPYLRETLKDSSGNNIMLAGFQGTFDGDYHAIKGLNVGNGDYVGFFRHLMVEQ